MRRADKSQKFDRYFDQLVAAEEGLCVTVPTRHPRQMATRSRRILAKLGWKLGPVARGGARGAAVRGEHAGGGARRVRGG